MSDESQSIRSINWREVFPFTNLFRSFRVAVHPSKIVLAMVALIVLYIGGRTLDALWTVKSRAVPNEAAMYEAYSRSGARTDRFKDRILEQRRQIEREYAATLVEAEVYKDFDAALADAKAGGSKLGELKNKLIANRNKRLDDLNTTHTRMVKAADEIKDKKQSEEARDGARRMYEEGRRAIYANAELEYKQAKLIKNRGLFAEFFEYQTTKINDVAGGVWRGNWFGNEGVIASLGSFLTVGPSWLITQHPFFFILFTLWFLLIWAIFGGAICRIAAVHVARDEKISMRQALRFSVGKVVSFVFAPIIPLIIVGVVGLLVTLGSTIANIPWLGPIVVGAIFFLALLAGFVMTLVMLGLVGGFNMMYPTIAVEGSDSFDAISRSFSYLYARPWRLAFYTAVSIAYGAITYLFVRLFVYMMLVMTHKFVGMGIGRTAENGAPLWNMIWPGPDATGRLTYDIPSTILGSGERLGAYLIAVWVFLAISVLGAFAISFYFSASTIIYYLMRKEVDATEMDDVYVEQTEDDFVEPAPVGTKPDAAITTAPTAPEPIKNVPPEPIVEKPQDTPPPT